MIARLFSLFSLFLVKLLSVLFYRYDIHWLGARRFEPKPDVKMVVLLNHTSLFEPLFLAIAPNWLIVQLAKRFIVPGADVTTSRPIVGRILGTLLPGMIPITRKRDDSWKHFLAQIDEQSIVLIMPEGRMRRASGLDKAGKEMKVRAGVADILRQLDEGEILFVYSGGLHHIQSPGQAVPKLFKRIKVNLELVDVAEYKKQILGFGKDNFTQTVVDDMQRRLAEKTPLCGQQPYHQDLEKRED